MKRRDRYGTWGMESGERALTWRDRALCGALVAAGEAEPDEWYPTSEGSDRPEVKKPKRVCRECPVRAECLRWALKHDEKGIWGALTERERRALKKRQVEAVA